MAGTDITAWAADMAGRLDDLGPELSTHIMAGVPELPDDPEMRAATEANAVAHIGAMAALLRYGIPPAGIEAPAQATEFARQMVHRGVGLPTLLRCYHVGQAKLWHQWVDLALSDVEDPAEIKALFTWSTDFISTYLDAVRESVVHAYTEERRTWERSQAAAREDAIRALLAGAPVDLEDVTRRLRYDLRRQHVAAVLRPNPAREPGADLRDLESAARALAAVLDAGPPLVMRASDGSVWCWASAFDLTPDQVAKAAAAIRLPTGCTGALGNPAHGAGGFRESHLQAQQALRVADGGLVAFADVALASTLLADPEAARRFAAAELGALDAEGETAARLRETLEAFLAEGASHKHAAARLALHEKTVLQRVRKAESELGRPLAGRRASVEAALVVRRLLPPGTPRTT